MCSGYIQRPKPNILREYALVRLQSGPLVKGFGYDQSFYPPTLKKYGRLMHKRKTRSVTEVMPFANSFCSCLLLKSNPLKTGMPSAHDRCKLTQFARDSKSIKIKQRDWTHNSPATSKNLLAPTVFPMKRDRHMVACCFQSQHHHQYRKTCSHPTNRPKNKASYCPFP